MKRDPPYRVCQLGELYEELDLYDSLFHPIINRGPVIPLSEYTIFCSDQVDAQDLNVLQPNNSFIVIPNTVSTGCAVIYFYNTNDAIIGFKLITFNSIVPKVITPVSGTVTVRYVFRCTPVLIDLVCPDVEILNPLTPYQFQNNLNVVINLQLNKINGGEIVTIMQPETIYTPTPMCGYSSYETFL